MRPDHLDWARFLAEHPVRSWEDLWNVRVLPNHPAEVGKLRVARRDERRRIAKGLAVVKAAKKKGLEVKSATIEGVALQFGEPASAPDNALDRWLLKHPEYAHSTEKH